MKTFAGHLVKVTAIAALMLGAAPIIDATEGPAFAKNGKGGGGDKGGGGGKSGGGKAKGGNGGSKSDSAPGRARKTTSAPQAAAPTRTKPSKTNQAALAAAAVEAEAEEDDYAPGLKKKQINAALGALNAAHASPQAFANASPNSRVGRIAAYRDAALVSEELSDYLKDAEEALANTPPPDADVDDLLAQQDAAKTDAALLDAEIARLEAALAEAGGTDETIEAALSDAKDARAVTETEIMTLDDDIATAQAQQDAYDAAKEMYDAAAAELDKQQDLAKDLLEMAANKEVTDDVIAELHRLLGLNEPIPPVEIDPTGEEPTVE